MVDSIALVIELKTHIDPGITAAYNGGTHMALEDLGIMRSIPGLTIVEPADSVMLADVLKQAAAVKGNFYIRLLRKMAVKIYEEGSTFQIGKAVTLREGTDVTIFASGICTADALTAADILATQNIQAQVINMFEDLQAKLGVAYLFIAHDLLVVHHISDRIAVMYLGRIVEIADADDLNAAPIHPYTQSLLSAAPYPDPKMAKERQRIILEGDVPSPLNMPKGCAFRTRCKYATERCAQECPTLTDRGNGHMVACFNK